MIDRVHKWEIRIIVDMNLSPEWGGFLELHRLSAQHWSEIGSPCARDAEIMDWAREKQHVILTQDLDFGILLALTQSQGPSIIQIRALNTLPENLGEMVVAEIANHSQALERGAILTIDESRARVRLLPIRGPLPQSPDPI